MARNAGAATMSQDVTNIWSCKSCHGVFSTAHGKSECPSFPGGGGCDPVWEGSREHVLHASAPNEGQTAWTICHKCKGVCFGAPNPAGSCPVGGQHEPLAGVDLMLYREGSTKPFSGERNFRWCKNCQGLFLWHPNAAEQGECPAFPGGHGHDGSQSSPYELAFAELPRPLRVPMAAAGTGGLASDLTDIPVRGLAVEPIRVTDRTPTPGIAVMPRPIGVSDLRDTPTFRIPSGVGTTSLVDYRDYLVERSTLSHERLAQRYHQDFATRAVPSHPAVMLATRTLERALAAPPPHGLGMTVAPGDGSSPHARLDALVQASGLPAEELERRYHVRLRRRPGTSSSEVAENIHALQRMLADDWQAETVDEPQSIVPQHDVLLHYVDRGGRPRQPGGGRFFLFYDEWVEQQRPFFAESHFRMEACARPGGTQAQALADAHEAMALGQFALAQARYLAVQDQLHAESVIPDTIATMKKWGFDPQGRVEQYQHRVVEKIGPVGKQILTARRDLPTASLADVRRLEAYFARPTTTPDEARNLAFTSELHLMACVLPVLLGDAAVACGQYGQAVHQYVRALPWSVIVGLHDPTTPEAAPFVGELAFTYAGTAPELFSAGPWSSSLRASQDPIDATLVLREALHHPVQERYVRLRLGHAMVEWADELHRQGGEGNTGRARELYKATLLLHGQDPKVTGQWPQRPRVEPTPAGTLNPDARAQIERAHLGLYRIGEGLDWFGLSHDLVPALRYRTLHDSAKELTSAARTAQADLMHHLGTAAEWMRERRRHETLVRHAQLQVRIAENRQEGARDAVAAAKQQVAAVEAAIVAKQAEIEEHEGLGQQFLDFFSGAVGAVSGLVKGGKEAAGLLSASDKAALASGAKGALGMGGQATAMGGLGVMAGYGLFVYAGYTSMSGLADAANQRRADLEALRGQALPAAQAAVRARQQEVELVDLQRRVAQEDGLVARELLQIAQLGALGPSLTADMIRLSRRLLQRYLDDGARMAWLAERALSYELGRDVAVVKHDYFPQERQGLGGAELLLADLHTLELTRLEALGSQLPVEHTFSLLRDFPLAFGALRRHGRCRVHTTELALQAAYPGTFGHRLVSARAVPVASNSLSPIRGMLRNDGVSLFADPRGKARPSVRPADALPISERRTAGPGDASPGETLRSFEGSGVDTFWELELPAAGNPQGLGTLGDVLLIVETRARYAPESRPAAASSAPPAIVLSLAREASDATRDALRSGQRVELLVDLDQALRVGMAAAIAGVAVLLVGEGLSGVRAAEIGRTGGTVTFSTNDGVAYAHTLLESAGGLAALLGQPVGSVRRVVLQPGAGRVDDVLLVLEPKGG
jgi:hypothetical protein